MALYFIPEKLSTIRLQLQLFLRTDVCLPPLQLFAVACTLLFVVSNSPHKDTVITPPHALWPPHSSRFPSARLLVKFSCLRRAVFAPFCAAYAEIRRIASIQQWELP
ncbi:hypothetical protein cyc_03867 [Cyclospora cayetanensis]|uniref:Uncharacterized protein n=1 Tax=Cyclospora cayetanensis TaxID=88456 RepID=A0A1D3CVB8_9EIME|nr:hypothetical protein cyc_03867 [Cyclospora cayetanensis]